MQSKSLFISPHNDDEALFGAFTLIREKPLVLIVTDSYIQWERGDGIGMAHRRVESAKSLRILGCPGEFGAIKDTEIDEHKLRGLFNFYKDCDVVYIPAYHENGNPHHNMINKVALEFWPDAIQYTTYSKHNLYETGRTEIIPTPEELELKNQALMCYESQINLPATRPHFDAVFGKSEWYA